MKKLLIILLSLFSLFYISSCVKKNDVIDDKKEEKEDSKIVKCNHHFNDDICDECKTLKNEYVFNLFGEDTIIYTKDITNPYNIDLDIYGENIYAIFYDPIYKGNIYKNIDKDEFYKNYKKASSYEDSYYRSFYGLMSGDIKEQSHLPKDGGIIENNQYVRCMKATYVLDTLGNYVAYIINDKNNNYDIIYYGGAYTSLNEVAAYLLAFGEVPVNSNYDKNDGQKTSIAKWGKFGRVNIDSFSGDVNRFPYEPLLPNVRTIKYSETDFGTIGGYKNESVSKTYNQTNYNNGKSISRGAARFCFVSDSRIKSIDERHVFYTYNHYNDFQEYLNYNDGFGKRFGNESAGNQYCSSAYDFNESATNDPTEYPNTLNKININ